MSPICPSDTNITTQDELEELVVTSCDKLMKAVDTSTPIVYSCNDPKSPISQAILDLIKEKHMLRRLYNNTQDPNIKSTINKLQKEIRTKINQESTISWEKFCNSISLESDPKKSLHKMTNFLKPKGPVAILRLTLIYMGYFDNLFYMGGAKKPPGLTLAFDFR